MGSNNPSLTDMVTTIDFHTPDFLLLTEAVQCVEHIRICRAKSPMNNKVVVVLPYWPQFNAITTGLKLLR